MEEHRDLSSSTPRHSAEHLLATAQNYQTPPRACLLIPDAVVGDHRGEEYAAEEGQGVLVVAGGDAAPVLEAVEAALDGVAVAAAPGCRRPGPVSAPQ
jgi:hypothetical protein